MCMVTAALGNGWAEFYFPAAKFHPREVMVISMGRSSWGDAAECSNTAWDSPRLCHQKWKEESNWEVIQGEGWKHYWNLRCHSSSTPQPTDEPRPTNCVFTTLQWTCSQTGKYYRLHLITSVHLHDCIIHFRCFDVCKRFCCVFLIRGPLPM